MLLPIMFSVLGIALAISVWSVRAQEGTTNATCFEEFNWVRSCIIAMGRDC